MRCWYFVDSEFVHRSCGLAVGARQAKGILMLLCSEAHAQLSHCRLERVFDLQNLMFWSLIP